MPYDRESRDRPPLPGEGQMQDFTDAFFVTAGVLLFVCLVAIWANYGLPIILVTTYFAHKVLRR